MAEIISFPAKDARDWAAIERGIIVVLRTAGVAPADDSDILRRMRAFVELLYFDVKAPLTVPDDACGQILIALSHELSLALKERTDRLIVDRLKRELDFYWLTQR